MQRKKHYLTLLFFDYLNSDEPLTIQLGMHTISTLGTLAILPPTCFGFGLLYFSIHREFICFKMGDLSKARSAVKDKM